MAKIYAAILATMLLFVLKMTAFATISYWLVFLPLILAVALGVYTFIFVFTLTVMGFIGLILASLR